MRGLRLKELEKGVAIIGVPADGELLEKHRTGVS
jgi:hypothetical protein